MSEARLIDANALISDSRICGNCKDYELCDGNIAFCPNASARRAINDAPTVDADPAKYGQWKMREKDKLIPTGEIAVSEGHILSKTGLDKPFTLQSANIIKIKEHRTIKMPYCSICGNYGDDEYDKTPYCPYCGAKMDKED